MAPGLVGTVVPVALVLEVLVVLVTSVLDGVPVVERLPPVGAEVMVGVASVVSVVSVVVASLLEVPEADVLLVVSVLPLLEDEDDEVPSALALMVKGNEYWKIVGSESRVMRMPYVFSVPSALSTAQEYWPAALSTASVDGCVSHVFRLGPRGP